MVKISTLLLYARIFPGPTFKRMLKTVCLFISTYSAIWIVTSIFQCRPVSRVWDPTVNEKCIDIDKVLIVMGSLNVLTDALLLCLPLPQLWRLQMRRRTKLQLTGIFSIGSLSVNPLRKFYTVLTSDFGTQGSLLFQSIGSRSCGVCLCTRTTRLGPTLSPFYGRS